MSDNPNPIPPINATVPPIGAPVAKPDSNIVWAILCNVLCCLATILCLFPIVAIPFGIVAIVKASKVDSLWMMGQYAEAQQAANAAKKWTLISAIVGGAMGIIYLLIIIALLANAS